MPQVKMPNGDIVAFPDGMSPTQITAYIRKWFPANGYDSPAAAQGSGAAPTAAVQPAAAPAATSGPASPATPPPSSPPAQQPGEPQGQATPGLLGDYESFVTGVANALPFDINRRATDAVGNTLNALTGGKFGYNSAQDEANDTATAAAHPVPAVAGAVGGTALGAMGIGALMPEALAPKAGQTALNALKLAGIGGGLSATDAALEGGSPGQIAGAAATGAVVAPIAGAAAGAVGKTLARTGTKAWTYIAKKIGEPAADVEAAVARYHDSTGQWPSIQQILNARAQGGIRNFARSNPIAAEGFQNAQAAAADTLPARVSNVIQQAGISRRPEFLGRVGDFQQNPNALHNALDDAMTNAMEPIRSTPVDLPPEVAGSKALRNAAPALGELADDGSVGPSVLNKLAAMANGKEPESPLTLGDIDTLRQGLRGLQAGGGKNAVRAKEYADFLTSAAADQVPEYADALDKYRAGARYIQGFEHSYGTGAPVATATEPSLRGALASDEGLAGHQAGLMTYLRSRAESSSNAAGELAKDLGSHAATSQAVAAATSPQQADTLINASSAIAAGQRAIQDSTLPRISDVSSSSPAQRAAVGLGEAAAGMHLAGLGRVGRAIASYLGQHRYPPAVQRAIVTGLTSNDPAVLQTTIARLRQTETNAAALARLSQALGIATGANLGAQETMGGYPAVPPPAGQ